MKKLCLREIKETELGILLHFRDFCYENNITFYLSNGTLLGAIKYNGFIPWDDDVDVLVPRADYDRLIKLYCDTSKYKLFSIERNKRFGYPFAKLCDMTTVKEEANLKNVASQGLDIDIFPLDAWNDNLNLAKKEVKKIYKNMYLLNLVKSEKIDSPNPIKRFVIAVIMLFCKLLGSKYFIKRMIKVSNSQSNTEYLGCKSWCIYGEREIITAEVFSNTIEVEFEGERFPAPSGYDRYLRSLYGDYEQEPPPEKQKTHHQFTAYRI